jgi:hypothetical protein
MKGATAEWFDSIRVAIGEHWNTGANNQDNFTDHFNARFVTETKKNQWYHELSTLRQGTNETVDAYANKFKKLAARIGLTDDAQKKRMFLMGLNPAYTPLVYAQNPGTIDVAITSARSVEIGFNYASGKPMATMAAQASTSTLTPPISVPVSITPIAHKMMDPTPVTNNEVDVLAEQIKQMSINYANLIAALMATTTQPAPNRQPMRRNFNQQRNPRSFNQQGPRVPRPIGNGACFNCEKSGHFSRECPESRRPRGNRPQVNFARDVHYVDFHDKDDYYTEDKDYEVYNYESEMYPALRSGRRYFSQSKTLHPKAQNQNNLRQEISEVKRNTALNSNILPDEEMDSESGEEEEFQMPASIPQTPRIITPTATTTSVKKTMTQIVNPTSTSKSKTKKYRMLPAQIESLTDFNVSEYLQSFPCGLTVGQAAHLLPKYRSGLNRATRRHRERLAEANMLGSDDNNEPTTAAKCTLRIEGRTHTAVVDSGAATSIITRPLLDKFNNISTNLLN